MKLIVGLGNPGDKYANNRHNAGFMFADYLIREVMRSTFGVRSQNTEFKFDNKLQADICKINISNDQLIIAKPQTFMNLSGEVVRKIVDYFNIDISDVIVAHDDLDLPIGKYKIQKNVGPKLHNGIISIEKHLGTSNFWRIRIGVENRNDNNRISGETYVLQDFTPEEKTIITKTFAEMNQKIYNII